MMFFMMITSSKKIKIPSCALCLYLVYSLSSLEVNWFAWLANRPLCDIDSKDAMMYFVRIDYIYRGSPVRRARMLVSSLIQVYKAVRSYVGEDYMLLSAKIERCV